LPMRPRSWYPSYQDLPTLGDKKTKTLIYYDAHTKLGDTGDEVPASQVTGGKILMKLFLHLNLQATWVVVLKDGIQVIPVMCFWDFESHRWYETSIHFWSIYLLISFPFTISSLIFDHTLQKDSTSQNMARIVSSVTDRSKDHDNAQSCVGDAN
jgi:hypothetical protein